MSRGLDGSVKDMHMKDIDRAISTAVKSHMFEQLERVYSSLPEGQCSGCTACCSESVPTFFIEFINIINYMREHKDLYEQVYEKIIDFYFTELTEKKSCPFLNDSRQCGIYEVRPLPCRLYGFSSYEDYEANLRMIKKSNRDVKKHFRNAYGIRVPDEVVNYQVPFCTDFIPERVIGKEERLDLSDMLFALDSKFLMGGLLDPEQINMNLVQWFAYLQYSEEEASTLRIQISQEILGNGSAPTLRKLLKKQPEKI